MLDNGLTRLINFWAVIMSIVLPASKAFFAAGLQECKDNIHCLSSYHLGSMFESSP